MGDAPSIRARLGFLANFEGAANFTRDLSGVGPGGEVTASSVKRAGSAVAISEPFSLAVGRAVVQGGEQETATLTTPCAAATFRFRGRVPVT